MSESSAAFSEVPLLFFTRPVLVSFESICIDQSPRLLSTAKFVTLEKWFHSTLEA